MPDPFRQVFTQRFHFAQDLPEGIETREHYDVSMPAGEPLFLEVKRRTVPNEATTALVELYAGPTLLFSESGFSIDGKILERAKAAALDYALAQLEAMTVEENFYE
jgi:hypothetical protein